jgi:hypothetical protein
MNGRSPQGSRPRACLYYSAGPHFHAALKALRAEFPDAHIVGMVPPNYPVSETDRTVADEFVETGRERYSPRMLADCIRLARSIRAVHYDVFAVMFRSGQLEALASLSGARKLFWISPRAKIIPLRAAFLSVVLSTILRRGRGLLTYGFLWILVRALPVKKGPDP